MFKQYTTAERREREKKQEKRFTAILRFVCGMISLLILAGTAYIVTHGGIDEWNRNPDFRESAPNLVLALLGLFCMTSLYAIRGDKSIQFIRGMFRD